MAEAGLLVPSAPMNLEITPDEATPGPGPSRVSPNRSGDVSFSG